MIAVGYETRAVDSHYRWKGQDACYTAIHQWMARHYPKQGECEWCGAHARTHWANLDGEYSRESREGWAELCVSCHFKHDKRDVRPAVADQNRAKTHCSKGHELTTENVYEYHRVRNGKWYMERQCRTCHRIKQERINARNRCSQLGQISRPAPAGEIQKVGGAYRQQQEETQVATHGR